MGDDGRPTNREPSPLSARSLGAQRLGRKKTDSSDSLNLKKKKSDSSSHPSAPRRWSPAQFVFGYSARATLISGCGVAWIGILYAIGRSATLDLVSHACLSFIAQQQSVDAGLLLVSSCARGTLCCCTSFALGHILHVLPSLALAPNSCCCRPSLTFIC